jgi:hypothetical protein
VSALSQAQVLSRIKTGGSLRVLSTPGCNAEDVPHSKLQPEEQVWQDDGEPCSALGVGVLWTQSMV